VHATHKSIAIEFDGQSARLIDCDRTGKPTADMAQCPSCGELGASLVERPKHLMDAMHYRASVQQPPGMDGINVQRIGVPREFGETPLVIQ
jgi:hypothetical protein